MRRLLRRGRREKERSEQGRGAALGGPLDRLLHSSFQYLAYGTLHGVAGTRHISRAWGAWTCMIRRLGSVMFICIGRSLEHITSVWGRKNCAIILRAIMKSSPINTQNRPLVQHSRVFSSTRQESA